MLRPFLDVFEEQTGIKANVVYLKKGSLERLKQQPGSVDALLTVDISNLTAIADAGLFQPINSNIIEQNVPGNYRDPKVLWTALTVRARVIFIQKSVSKSVNYPPMKHWVNLETTNVSVPVPDTTNTMWH